MLTRRTFMATLSACLAWWKARPAEAQRRPMLPIQWKPHPKQREFMESSERRVVYQGGISMRYQPGKWYIRRDSLAINDWMVRASEQRTARG